MRLIILCMFAAAVFAQSPSSFENHLTAGQAAMQHSRYTEADTQFRAAVAEAAQPDPNRTPMREVEAYSALCDLDLLMSRYDEAIAMASKAVDTAKAANAPDLTPQLGRLAGAYRVAGKTVLAVPACSNRYLASIRCWARTIQRCLSITTSWAALIWSCFGWTMRGWLIRRRWIRGSASWGRSISTWRRRW